MTLSDNDPNQEILPGESGPRRRTPTVQEAKEDDENDNTLLAANAEAARLATQLGVSTSSSSQQPLEIASRRANEVSSPIGRISSFGANGTLSPTNSVTNARFHALPSDGNAAGVGLRSPASVNARVTSFVGSQQSESGMYSPPGSIIGGARPKPERHDSMDDMSQTNSMGNPHMFDQHGQRAPYYDGPHIVSKRADGTTIRKRWYGRMEDGYLAWMSVYLHDYFGATIYHPPAPGEVRSGNVPKWCLDFYSLPNLAIPISYFCIGVALQLLRTPLIVYFIDDLSASAAEVNVLFTVMAVPWCFKMFYGFLSDCVPISGLRRKPYFMTGWVIFVVSNLILAATPVPSVALCVLLVFTQTAGYMLADVMTDALIVERSRYESQEERGTMQSLGYSIRFLGSTIGAIIGTVVYNKGEWKYYLPINVVFFINAAFPMLLLIPLVPFMMELETGCIAKGFFAQCRDLFETVQLRAVWQPMTFVYVYNAFQLTNAAWMNFLVEGLDFAAWEIGLVSIAGSMMAWIGILAYQRFFFASNWRVVYFWCTTLASIIALGQLILVFRLNTKMGIPDILFSMGDDVLVEFVIAVQFLPMCIMYLGLCPEGSEGTTYAMLTTWSNLAGSFAFDLSTVLTAVWDVSSEAIESGNYEGVWKLSLLCGLVGPVPLVLLCLIPKDKEDQRKLQQDTSRHFCAGVTFLVVMFGTLILTFAESIYEVSINDDDEESEDVEEDLDENVRRKLFRMMVGH